MNKKLLIIGLVFSHGMRAEPDFPSVCDVIKASNFSELLELTTSPTVCGAPFPKPCTRFSYYIPKYFVEVAGNPKETFFKALPAVDLQLKTVKDVLPFAAEDDVESYSFHAHALNIPFSQWMFDELPCAGAPPDALCFSTMSEHLGSQWKTGTADLWQPSFQAWAVAPKACLVAGAAASTLKQPVTPTGTDTSLCSVNFQWLSSYPPTTRPVCTGWGILFPRTGTVTSSDQTTASLLIASRIRSLGAEVFKSMSVSGDEKWQMVLPQISSGFREFQNIGFLLPKGVHELGRLKGNYKNYLYAIWQKKTCTRDTSWLAATRFWLKAMKSTCQSWR